jgi:hypothetical protein
MVDVSARTPRSWPNFWLLGSYLTRHGLDTYMVAAGECGMIQNDAQRRTCQDAAYSAYRSCANTCHQTEVADCLELCREQCDKANVLCVKNCPKGDKACLAACNDENGRCLKACSNRCK